ncbi:MAG: paraquat-inducible protein A [Cycloclasticus sp.]
MTKFVPIVLFVLSLAFLLPGLTTPLMTIEAKIDKKEMIEMGADLLIKPGQSRGFIQDVVESLVQDMGVEGELTVFTSTRSLLATMRELLLNGHLLVGVLIGLFGLVIPLIKMALVTWSFVTASASRRKGLLKISGLLGKWSMSDVFLMSVLVAFFAINANEYADDVLQMQAELHEGFYYFATYCLLAILANQLMERKMVQGDLEQGK